MYQNNNFDALRLAIKTCTKIDYSKVRVAKNRDTLHLSQIEISESLLDDVKYRKNYTLYIIWSKFSIESF